MVVMYMYVMVKHFASIIVPDDAKEQISVIDNEITKSQGFDFYSYLIYVLFITISFFSTTSTVTLTTTANSSSRVTSTRSLWCTLQCCYYIQYNTHHHAHLRMEPTSPWSNICLSSLTTFLHCFWFFFLSE